MLMVHRTTSMVTENRPKICRTPCTADQLIPSVFIPPRIRKSAITLLVTKILIPKIHRPESVGKTIHDQRLTIKKSYDTGPLRSCLIWGVVAFVEVCTILSVGRAFFINTKVPLCYPYMVELYVNLLIQGAVWFLPSPPSGQSLRSSSTSRGHPDQVSTL